MKVTLIILIPTLLVLNGCSSKSTEPESVPVESQISVTGDVTESYKVAALFGISTYTSDTTEKEYFTILLVPHSEGSNPFAFTTLFKSGSDLPSTQTYLVRRHGLGEDIPATHFGGGFSGINTEDFAGYTMTDGTITFKSISQSIISGDLNMSGHWAQGIEEDSSRAVTITGNFSAIPIPED